MSGEQEPERGARYVGDLKHLDELLAELAPGAVGDTNDSAANREAAAIADGTLEEQSKRSEHRRTEHVRETVHRAVIWGVWLIWILFVTAGVIVAWHLFTPEGWCWLAKEKLETLKAIVFSGSVMSAAGNYLSKRM